MIIRRDPYWNPVLFVRLDARDKGASRTAQQHDQLGLADGHLIREPVAGADIDLGWGGLVVVAAQPTAQAIDHTDLVAVHASQGEVGVI
jgi:hypothetical protein